jgi:endonuclease/exonuclease/phosphatase (EEP) superfamily protein YafD
MQPVQGLKPSPKNIMAVIIATLSTTTLLVACCGFLPDIWMCDIASQFRIVWAWLLGSFALMSLLLRSKVAIAISLIGFFINGYPIASMLQTTPCPKSRASHRSLSILNFNTESQHNDHYDLLLNLIHLHAPDVVVLVEVNQKWIDAIEPATKAYPYKNIVIEGPGLALFSKFPIENSEVHKFGKSFHPRIIATLRIDRTPVQIVVAHPTTPQSEGGFVERNREFDLLKKEIGALRSPKILIGDLNCGPWSPAFVNLLAAGLVDSEQGVGPQPSWPARAGRVINSVFVPPVIPIDHLLVSDDVCVTDRKVGPAMQSDHLPVFVKVLLP